MHKAGIRARRLGVAALATLGLTAVAAPSAFAGTATFDGGSGTVGFQANAGEENDVRIFNDSGQIKVLDDNNPVTPGTGCTADFANQADCGPAAVLTAISASLLDKDDRINTSGYDVPANIDLGAGDDFNVTTGEGNDIVSGGSGQDDGIDLNGGNDTFNGGPGNDSDVNGGTGDDTLNGDAGNDGNFNGDAGNDALNGGTGDDGNFGGSSFDGGDGNDTIHGDAGDDNGLFGGAGDDNVSGDDGNDTIDGGFTNDGNDVYSGGAGFDVVDYFGRDNPLNISGDGVANDGEAGELDNVNPDIETIDGGGGDDTLTAPATGGRGLFGNGGNDTLNGGAASESIDGGPGDDTENGNDGSDQFDGGFFGGNGTGNDTVNGGNGDDHIYNGGGKDVFNGGAGVDEIDYDNAGGPVQINPNGQPISGEANEGDTVAADIENESGGFFGDLLIGTPATNLIRGGEGNDFIVTRDAVSDDVLCGGGSDTVVADGIDVTAADGNELCEKVDRGSLAGALTGQKLGSITTSISSKATSLTVPFLCGLNVQGGCQGSITINTGGSSARAAKRVGKATFITPPATRINVRVPLSKSSRSTLRKKKKLKVTITVLVQDARGASGTVKKTLTLKRKK